MPRGNDFRRDQRQEHRNQLRLARMRFDAFRRQIVPRMDPEAARRERQEEERERQAELERLELEQQSAAEAARREEEEERQLQAEEEAAQREETDRIAREAEARRIEMQERARRQQEKQARRALAQAQALAHQQQVQLQQAEQERRRVAAELLASQEEAADNALPGLIGDLQAGLPALRNRCGTLERRASTVVRALTGTTSPDLLPLQQDIVLIVAVAARCNTNLQSTNQEILRPRTCALSQRATITIAVHATLAGHRQVLTADTVSIIAIDGRVATAEASYADGVAKMLAYPNLNLNVDEIAHPLGVIRTLSNDELARLNTKLAGHRVTSWVTSGMPTSRGWSAGTRRRIPAGLEYFPYPPSSEVFHDWVYEDKPDHGQPAATMRQLLDPNSNTRRVITVDEELQTGGRRILTSRNSLMKVIVAADGTLITFYWKR